MTGWEALEAELALWQREGRTMPVWWRDDDAVADTSALRRLAELGGAVGLPIHIAVIPAHVEDSLVTALDDLPTLHPLVHGWAHENHAGTGQKKAEFGADRPLEVLEAEAARGLATLRDRFGERLLPVFVPPWNRMTDALIPRLPGLGYRYLSTFTPRSNATPAPGLTRINTHIDPIDWKGSRSLVTEDGLLDTLTAHLQARRAGTADAREPLGLLTHHLVQDDAIWSFCARLARLLMEGPGTSWSFEKGPAS